MLIYWELLRPCGDFCVFGDDLVIVSHYIKVIFHCLLIHRKIDKKKRNNKWNNKLLTIPRGN